MTGPKNTNSQNLLLALHIKTEKIVHVSKNIKKCIPIKTKTYLTCDIYQWHCT